MKYLRVVMCVALLATALWSSGQSVHAQSQTVPTLTAPVNDLANVIDAASAAELDRLIRVLQAATGDVVVVATVDTFAPFATIEEYATKMFQQSGVGTRAQDNGALILLAVKDRRVRIEVGYGLEEFLTDGFSGETIRTQMLPMFRESRYGQGLVDGTTRVVMRIAEKRGVTLDNVSVPVAPQRSQRGRGLTPGAAILLFVIIALLNRFGGRGGGSSLHRRGRGTWSGWHGGIGGFGGGFGSGGFGGGGFGGGGGGFGGFGGGRSGGGGGSGGW